MGRLILELMFSVTSEDQPEEDTEEAPGEDTPADGAPPGDDMAEICPKI